MKKYKYRVLSDLGLPPPEVRSNPNSPVMNNKDVEWVLNDLGGQGWELVSYGEKHWLGLEPFTQTFWVFRREVKP